MPTTYAIPDGRVAMAATTYTGTGSALSVSNAVNGVSFKPDFVWIKGRSAAYNHGLFDSVRGARDVLSSNLTAAEVVETAGTSMTSFDSGGFSLGTNGATVSTNINGSTFVGWQWKAGGTAVSNTAGSITSSVSANPTAGFSVVTYTGISVPGTVGHGLGVAPSMVIVKSRSNTSSWAVWHTALTGNEYLLLESTAAKGTASTVWNGTTPTSTVFSVGSGSVPNSAGFTYVAYCFAPVAGYSAFGSYTGNGSADGPFVYFGFRPRYVMLKSASSAGGWIVWDTSRNPSNISNLELSPNNSNAESDFGASYYLDILSNGIKIRGAGSGFNVSSENIIYACFAESPFKYANAR